LKNNLITSYYLFLNFISTFVCMPKHYWFSYQKNTIDLWSWIYKYFTKVCYTYILWDFCADVLTNINVNVISRRLFMSIFQFKLVFILLSIVWCCIFQLYWFKKRKKNYILIITSSFHMWNEFLKLNYYNFTVLRPLEVVLYSLALGDDRWINHSQRDKKLFINSKCISSGIIEYW
jgi:hypothetical protein